MISTKEWQEWLFELYFQTYPAAREEWAAAGFYDLEHGCVSDLALAWHDDMAAMNESSMVPTEPEMRMYREGRRRTNQGWVPAPPQPEQEKPAETSPESEVPF